MKACSVFLILAFSCTVFSEIRHCHKQLEAIREIVMSPEETSEDNEQQQIAYSCNQPSSCAELYLKGITKSGIYTIYPKLLSRKDAYPKNLTLQVYCDMITDGGGWTVIQRRDDFLPRENFFRGWNDYRKEFGDLDKEFWLGNDNLHILTNQDYVTLRVDLEDFDGSTRFAVYNKFRVANGESKFRADVGDYNGDAGNGLIRGSTSATFVTYDNGDINKCAEKHKGGWWYTNCHTANLNGLYLRGSHSSYADGVIWYQFKGYNYSLKRSEMKIRPSTF